MMNKMILSAIVAVLSVWSLTTLTASTTHGDDMVACSTNAASRMPLLRHMLTECVVFVAEQDYAVLAMVKVPISTLSVVSV